LPIAVDYWIIQLRFCILDAICGPEPPTAVDQEREGDRDGMRQAFRDVDATRFGAVLTKTIRPSKPIRPNKRKAKLKAKHRRQRARATG
jgi:hypothetical protein